ncbi:MAG: hypothetical protein EZS28_014889 [Streblomastix strix]|uniref:SPRY domain-containing protein n=1 Tax=Streblomastix strix TaxID=222440 RepID=A0A5J4W4V5_9EUKA|nr:MAG: hypothetical protein EZS28_014889 [Streblomastix strix]
MLHAYNGMTDVQLIGLIPQIAINLRSSDVQQHIQALQQLLITVTQVPSCMAAIGQHDLVGVLKNFLVKGVQSELTELSIGILGIIGVRCNGYSKRNQTVMSVNSLLQIIHTTNEKLSGEGSDALCKLIGTDQQIKQVLYTKPFIYQILQSLSMQAPTKIKQSSASAEEEYPIQDFVKAGLLAVVLKLAEDDENLNELGELIPVLEELKNKAKGEVKSKARNLLIILSGSGVIHQQLQHNDQKEKQYCELEELLRRKDEEIRLIVNERNKEKQEMEKLNLELMHVTIERDKALQDCRQKDDRIAELQMYLVAIQTKQELDSFNSSEPKPGPIPITVVVPQGSYNKKDHEFTYTSTFDEKKTFPIDQVVSSGVYRCEFRNNKNASAFGIMKSGVVIPFGVGCGEQPYCRFNAYYQRNGYVSQNGKDTTIGYAFKDGDTFAIEVSMPSRTATLYIQGKQLPVFISGLPEQIQFFFFINSQHSSVSVLSLKRLATSSAKKISGALEVLWE